MNQPLQNLLAACQAASESSAVDENEERIHVSAPVSKVAGLYEWLRNSLEFKEEHLVRRSAIERILRRVILFGGESHPEEGRRLLRELIRAGYLPNDTLSESKALEVSRVLSRYGALFALLDYQDTRLHNFLLGLASVEIEHLLAPREKLIEEAFVTFAYEQLKNRILWRGALRSPDHEAQIFIAVHRTVLRSDNPTIQWTLFTAAEPGWRSYTPQDAVARVRELMHLEHAVALQLAHPAAKQYARVLRRFVPAFTILHDVLVTKTAAFPVFATDPQRFLQEVEGAARARTAAVHTRLARMAVRATIYVFITKMLVAFAVELPAEHALGSFTLLPFVINLSFPPLLMFIAAKTAFVPGGKNISRITSDARAFVFANDTSQPIHEVKIRVHSGALRPLFFSAATALFFAAAIWGITAQLLLVGYLWISIVVFFFFLCVVSFFAWRIRQPARDLTAVGGREDPLGALIEFAAFPFLLVGRWISDGFARVNISLLVLDLAIEAPLKVMFDFADEWMRFLREKREEMLE